MLLTVPSASRVHLTRLPCQSSTLPFCPVSLCTYLLTLPAPTPHPPCLPTLYLSHQPHTLPTYLPCQPHTSLTYPASPTPCPPTFPANPVPPSPTLPCQPHTLASSKTREILNQVTNLHLDENISVKP